MCGRLQLCLFHLSIYISFSIVICEDGEIMTFTSYEGGSVNIRCPYDAQYINNTKYLCRGKCPTVPGYKVIPIESGRSPDDPRFSLNGDKTVTMFTVTIRDLRREDGGQYWCAVKRSLPMRDVYTEVLLSVKNVSHVSGVKGEELSVKCRYDHDVINNDKFLCKGDNLSLCERFGVKVSGGKITNGRFSLIDDTSARVFTVTINGLTEEDSGIYWCGNVAPKGSRQARDKWISAIVLNVSEVASESTSHKPTTASFHTIQQPTSPDSSSRPPPSSPSSLLTSSSSAHASSPNTDTSLMWIIALPVMLMLILFGFVLFIHLRQRKKNDELQLGGGARGSDGVIKQTRVSVCDYEEIHVHPDYSLVLPASGEHDASVYALAQNISSDNLHYSTIRFTDHSDRSSPYGQISCDYASAVL